MSLEDCPKIDTSEMVFVGPFTVLKGLPANTHLMAAWGAIWAFGHKIQVGNKSVKPIPMLRDSKFFISRNPFQDIAIPGTEMALVIQVERLRRPGARLRKLFRPLVIMRFQTPMVELG
jgi:hypothetical protein